MPLTTGVVLPATLKRDPDKEGVRCRDLLHLTHFPCQGVLPGQAILTWAVVGVSEHERMSVGVLAMLKIGHA